MERELLARGGVTRGLGPFLRQAYGESDLRRVLVEHIQAAVTAEQWHSATEMLQLDVSAGGVLPRRELTDLARHPALASWLFRAISMRPDGVSLHHAVGTRSDTSEAFKTLVAAQQSEPPHPHADESARIAFSAPVSTLFVASRPTERPRPRSDRKVGRNDPCPCGSGKKFKKCHANDEDFQRVTEATTLDDVPGYPGVGSDQMFWFRNADEISLADLCKRRLETSGPRVGETLFWPSNEAPDDELLVRAQMAAAELPDALPELLSRGLEAGVIRPSQALDQIGVAFPVDLWLDRPPVSLMAALTPAAAERLTVAGNITAAQVLVLASDEALRLGWLRDGLSDLGSGNPEPLVCLARALAQAGRPEEAYLALHHCRVSGHPLTLDQVHRLRILDRSLAQGLGNTPLPEGDWLARDDRVTQMARLRAEIKELRLEHEEIRAQLTRSEELRARAEKAWSERADTEQPPGEQLRREVRRLKGLLTQEHDKRRGVERNLENMRRRERARLLQQSSIEEAAEAQDDAAEATTDEPAEPARGRHVRYHPDFESVAQRLAPSTVARVRQNVEDLAAGRWVREAKRMEGLGNIWTLRAGIHYRALIREGHDHLEVYALIPREELDSTLARLRQ